MLLAVGYGFVYVIIARSTISRVMDADPAYKGRWPRPTWLADARNAFAVLHIMINMNLPKPDYPRSLQWRIWVARVMLWLWPFVLVAVLVLTPH
ncbi:hypothetical protein Y886_36755 [Xanthomonas hyacinthi DSM 19077]|nr:hypothetical protein Y886_36755 [Xanthomonas hyacinthi DSM 19077]